MKKTFTLSHPKIAYPRLIEAAKADIRKYLKRERNKRLPEYADYWGFDCKFGEREEGAEVLHVAQINDKISFAESQQWATFYVEILATPAQRQPRPVSEDDDAPESEAPQA